jgi:Xaa-Pro dipeptidase
MSRNVDTILAGKYPAKAHARRVAEYIKKSRPTVSGVLYLEGQRDKLIEDNDSTVPFR